MKLILTGGFLGSGKTTAIVNACRQLVVNGERVAVITNDQGEQQVDAAFVKSTGIPSRAVSNGCFCCRYDELGSHLETLIKEHNPSIIFAESVGSCTDLVATVVKPLQRFNQVIDIMVCIFADAELLTTVIEGKASFFDDSVRYIYRKQLEEADLIVVSKIDRVNEKQLSAIDTLLRAEYPNAEVIAQSSLDKADISKWVKLLQRFRPIEGRTSLDIDYHLYGTGEAQMAWLDSNLELDCPLGNGGVVVREIIRSVFNMLHHNGFPIGHVKFFIGTSVWSEKVSFTAVSTNAEIRIKDGDLYKVTLLINARVQSRPEQLQTLVEEVLQQVKSSHQCAIHALGESAFSPGYPKPAHRKK